MDYCRHCGTELNPYTSSGRCNGLCWKYEDSFWFWGGLIALVGFILIQVASDCRKKFLGSLFSLISHLFLEEKH